MLRWRLVTSIVIISGLFFLGWLDFNHNYGRPGIWLVPAGWLVAIIATGEMLVMLRSQSLRPIRWSTFVGTVSVVVAATAPVFWKEYPDNCPLGKFGWPMSALAFGVAVAFLAEMLSYEKPGEVIANIAASVFVMAYVGVLMSFLVALRIHKTNEIGMTALVSMIVIVKVSDIGAYTVGRIAGRHKLAPRMSPGKTIEGAIGAIVFGAITSWLVLGRWLPGVFGAKFDAPAWLLLVYGLTLAIAGMFGDMAESIIKRDAGRKDSSRWMPGLGGVLDVMDSVLGAAPAAFAFWVAGLWEAF